MTKAEIPTYTTCSECFSDLVLDRETGLAETLIPSNGLRGSKHVPSHVKSAPIWTDEGDVEGDGILYWDCPSCGHADSYSPYV